MGQGNMRASDYSMTNPTPNPAEQAANRQEALKFMQQMMQQKKDEHVPIVKSLEQMGIRTRTMTVMVGDMPQECLIIPIAELVQREYEFMSHVNVAGLIDAARVDQNRNDFEATNPTENSQ